MNTYQPPCYTIEEACSMLAITQTEFKHAVQMEQIKPVLYIAGKQMLIFTPETRHEWVGHAVVKYRGHYSAQKTVISALLDGEERKLGQGWGRILDQAGIEQISHKYPFQTPRPFGTLVDWRILDEKTEHIYQKSATPLPNEGDTLLGVLNSFANKLNKTKVIKDNPQKKITVSYETPKRELNFNVNSLIKPEAIRIPKSEVEAFKRSIALASKELPLLGAQSKTSTRSSQLHELVSRILKTDPKLSAKRIWQVLVEESVQDEPLFDTDHILLVIDANGLTWVSRDGNEQPLKWASFQSLVSRVRKDQT